MSDSTAPKTTASKQFALESEQARMLFQAMPGSLAATAVNAAVLAGIQWSAVGGQAVTVWLGLAIAAVVARAGLTLLRRHDPAHDARARTWIRRFHAATLAQALLWAAASLWLFPSGAPAHQVFLAFIIGGVSAGAVSSLSFRREIVTGFLLISLLPLVTRLLLEGSAMNLAMGGMVLLFLAVVLNNAWRIHASTLQNIQLRLESERQESKARESESGLRAVIEQAADAMFIHDRGGRLLEANRQACAELGYTRDELLNMRMRDFDNEPQEEIPEELWQRMRDGEVAAREASLRRRDGSGFPVELKMSRVDWDGQPLCLAIGRDLTQRKRFEQSLLQYKHAVENTLEGIAILKSDGEYVFLNPAHARLYGYDSPADLIGKSWHDLYRDDELQRFENNIMPRLMEAGRWSGIATGKRRDGSSFPQQLSLVTLSGGEIVCVVRDITAARHAEQAVLSSERRFRLLVENAGDAFFLHDQEGKLIDVNRQACASLGYSRDELLNMRVEDIEIGADEAEFERQRPALLKGETVKIEGVHRRKDGATFPVEVAVCMFNEGEQQLILALARDITERKKVDRLKDEFISTVSHELRTPLTSIRGALGLLNGGIAGELPSEVMSLLDIANNNAERLLLLINDILDIQKMQAGIVDFHFERIDLMDFLEQAIHDNQGLAQEQDVKFRIMHRAADAKVFADPDRLMQVVNNLLSNAAKFSRPQGNIDIHVSRRNDFLRIAVTDHGPGIPLEFQSQLFSRFTQLDASDTRSAGGTGLGLNIAKTIVERLNGRIDFVSAEDLGTTIYVDLPALSGATANAADDVLRANMAEQRQPPLAPRILLVGSQSRQSALLARHLTESGYGTRLETGLDTALSAIEHTQVPYHAVICDLELAGGRGLQLLRALRTRHTSKQSRFIAATFSPATGVALIVTDWISSHRDRESSVTRLMEQSCLGSMASVVYVGAEEGFPEQCLKSRNLRCSSNRSARDTIEAAHGQAVIVELDPHINNWGFLLPGTGLHAVAIIDPEDGGEAEFDDMSATLAMAPASFSLHDRISTLLEAI